MLSIGGRVTQDFRTVIQDQLNETTGGEPQARLWPRFMYRNATELGNGFRVSATLTGETSSTLRPALSYAPPSESSSLFLNTALLQYRTGQVEFAVGRDQLPTGINGPDLGLWLKSRNQLGYYDAPIQAKMFWTGPRVHLTPFVYAPSGNDKDGWGEKGVGTLAEFVLGSRQRTVLGASILGGTAPNGSRQTLGGYARLGFGQWGILAEHDWTERTPTLTPTSFNQNTSFGQVFWAIREWLVLSGIGERLRVDQPFEERAVAGKLELAARLAPQATVTVSTRVQKDQITERTTTSIVLQAALKTVR